MLLPLLVGNELASWDGTPHYFIYLKFLEHLEVGKIWGYSEEWYAGMPWFSLYPPFFYLCAAFLYFVSFGLISKLISFNIAVCFLPFLLCFSYAFLAKKIGANFKIALLLLLISLFLPLKYAHYGLGLSGLLYIGLLPSFLALSLLALFLAKLICFKNTSRDYLIASVLLALILYTHILSFIFALFSMLIYLLGNRKKIIPVLIINILALLFSIPFLIQFFKHLPFSSGVEAGANYAELLDPLAIIWTNLSFDFLNNGNEILRSGFIGQADYILSAPKFLAQFPWLGLMLAIFGILGTVTLFNKQKPFIASLFLVALIFLPRNYLLNFSDLGIHYYRFIQQIYYIYIVIVAVGLTVTIEKILLSKPLLTKILLKSCTIVYLVFLVIFQLSFGLDWMNLDNNTGYRVSLQAQPEYQAAQTIIAEIKKLNPSYRIAVESNHELSFTLGSPHFFTAKIPIETKLEAVPGLLAESSLSSNFINSALAIKSRHLLWGDTSLQKNFEFKNQSLKSMLERLSLYSVGYILSTSAFYKRNLERLGDQTLKKLCEDGQFAIFELVNKKPKEEQLKFKPYLYFGNLKSFRSFAKYWYKHNKVLDYPILKARQDLELENELQYSGLIIDGVSNVELIKKYVKKFKVVFVINSKLKLNNVYSFSNFNSDSLERSDFFKLYINSIIKTEQAAHILYRRSYVPNNDFYLATPSLTVARVTGE